MAGYCPALYQEITVNFKRNFPVFAIVYAQGNELSELWTHCIFGALSALDPHGYFTIQARVKTSI
jgi:hypothetical protein